MTFFSNLSRGGYTAQLQVNLNQQIRINKHHFHIFTKRTNPMLHDHNWIAYIDIYTNVCTHLNRAKQVKIILYNTTKHFNIYKQNKTNK